MLTFGNYGFPLCCSFGRLQIWISIEFPALLVTMFLRQSLSESLNPKKNKYLFPTVAEIRRLPYSYFPPESNLWEHSKLPQCSRRTSQIGGEHRQQHVTQWCKFYTILHLLYIGALPFFCFAVLIPSNCFPLLFCYNHPFVLLFWYPPYSFSEYGGDRKNS